MPKGQYQRKPKVIGAEQVVPDVRPADIKGLAEPTATWVVPDDAKFVSMHDLDGPVLTAAEIAHLGGVPGVPAEPERETFDDWMEADVPVLPANDRITQMVGEWAASFCPGDHFVTWLPSADAQSIVVTLNTAHGTSELTRHAGQWREADIAGALAAMRAELGV